MTIANTAHEGRSIANDAVWMTRPECAEYLNISVRWLASAEGRGCIPFYKFGNQCRYNRTEVDKWASQQRA